MPGRARAGAPFRWLSSIRLTHGGTAISNYRPLLGWLDRLREPLYGRVTPDGHPLVERAWASPGQMMARFEIAGAIGGGRASLLGAEGTRAGGAGPTPTLDTALFQSAIAPTLGPRTRDALARATSQGEWNTVLLAAPEWMRR